MPARVDTWIRWQPLWQLACAANIVFCTGLAVVAQPRDRAPILLVSALLLAPTAALVRRRPAWSERPPVMSAYLALATMLSIVGSRFHPVYLAIAGCLTAQIFTLLPMRWAVPHVVLLGTLMAIRMHELRSPTGALLVVLSMAFGTGLALFISAIARQSAERARWIAELEATRRELLVAEREAAVAVERQRVSHEIHDTLTQDLIAVVRILDAVDAELPSGASAARASIERARAAARDGLAQSRRVVWSMRPPLLAEGSLVSALRASVDRFQRETSVATDLVVPDAMRTLPGAVEVTLLRAAQEALQNVAKHARARAVTVTLSDLGACVTLDVQDDGQGFVPTSVAPIPGAGGFGLVAMRERVAQVGGVVAIESTHGEGTTVGVQVPLGGAAP